MKNKLINKNQTFIIAEIGNNHEGNFIKAKTNFRSMEVWC